MVQLYDKFKERLVKGFQYILCYGSTSTVLFHLHSTNQFQYILCYGSTFVLF